MLIPMRKPTIADSSEYHKMWEVANALLYPHYEGMRGFSAIWSDGTNDSCSYTPGPIDDELADALMIPTPYPDGRAVNGLFRWHGLQVQGGFLDGKSITLLSRTEEVPLYLALASAGDIHSYRLGITDESQSYESLRYFSIPLTVVKQGDVAMAAFIRDTYL